MREKISSVPSGGFNTKILGWTLNKALQKLWKGIKNSWFAKSQANNLLGHKKRPLLLVLRFSRENTKFSKNLVKDF